MMGSVQLPPAAAIDHVHALLAIIADPARAKETLAQMKALRDEIVSKHAGASELVKAAGDREAALKAREDAVATAEQSLAAARKKIEADRADLDRRLGLLRQAVG